MPREFPRTRRVGEQLQRELAKLIFEELKDPRLGMVSVSGAKVSRDMSHAKVYVSVLGDGQATTDSLKVLNHAAGFLRHKLGQRMHLRTVPELRFIFDNSIEEGARIDALIDAAVSGRGTGNENGRDDES